MNLIHPHHPDEGIVFSYSLPSSFTNLPPPRIPSKEDLGKATELRDSLVKRFGLRPGTYRSLNQDTYERVEAVYQELVNCLVADLSQFSLASLCLGLYKRQEQFYGYLNKRRYQSIPDMMLVGDRQASEQRDDLWIVMTPFTEATRWLIEIGIKVCELSGDEVSDSTLDRLTSRARVILEWDLTWEHIAHGVLPHELTVGSDLTVTVRPTRRAVEALRAHREAMLPWRIEEHSQWMDVALAEKKGDHADYIDPSEDDPLNGPMEAELAYSMTDWKRYLLGLVDSFDLGEYIKDVPRGELSQFMSSKWRISPACLEALLIDHALSKETLAGLNLDKLRPAEHARRDSRLLRRPIVVLQCEGTPTAQTRCIYGIETLTSLSWRFPAQLMSGRVHLPRMAEDGPVTRAVGRIQSELGTVFRDMIWKSCNDDGLTSIREKTGAGSDRIPQGQGFGPVDVFIVDRQNRRFVLAEAKDTDDPGFVSSEMKAERDEYRTAVLKVKRQVCWFAERMASLKLELGIDPSEDYVVEGVVVINRPRLWMYIADEPMPIVTDKDLLAKLRDGESLLTSPIAVGE